MSCIFWCIANKKYIFSYVIPVDLFFCLHRMQNPRLFVSSTIKFKEGKCVMLYKNKVNL